MALDKLTDAGAHGRGAARRLPRGDGRAGRAGVDVVTLPYPGFPTDLQPMAVALAAVSSGTALITENVFEGRFMFVNELVRLGADVRIDGHHAVVRGRERLSSAPVVATDIRAGAGLVLAGLVSDGVTEVQEVHHVDRGYPDFVEQLRRPRRPGRADHPDVERATGRRRPGNVRGQRCGRGRRPRGRPGRRRGRRPGSGSSSGSRRRRAPRAAPAPTPAARAWRSA